MMTEGVRDLEQRIQKAKSNVEEIQTIVQSWVSPIFERKDGKRESLLSLEDCQDCLEKRYSLVRESGQRIHSLVKVRGCLLALHSFCESVRSGENVQSCFTSTLTPLTRLKTLSKCE